VTSYASVEEAWREVQRGAAASFHLALVAQAAVDAADPVALEGIQISLPVLSTCALTLAHHLSECVTESPGSLPARRLATGEGDAILVAFGPRYATRADRRYRDCACARAAMADDVGLRSVATSVMQGYLGCMGLPLQEADMRRIWELLLDWKVNGRQAAHASMDTVVEALASPSGRGGLL